MAHGKEYHNGDDPGTKQSKEYGPEKNHHKEQDPGRVYYTGKDPGTGYLKTEKWEH